MCLTQKHRFPHPFISSANKICNTVFNLVLHYYQAIIKVELPKTYCQHLQSNYQTKKDFHIQIQVFSTVKDGKMSNFMPFLFTLPSTVKRNNEIYQKTRTAHQFSNLFNYSQGTRSLLSKYWVFSQVQQFLEVPEMVLF